MSDAVKIRLEVACNCYVMREQCLPCDARYEIERLEAIVKGLEECDAEDKAEIARLRTALEEIRDFDVDDEFGYTDEWTEASAFIRSQEIAREALNDE